MPSSWFSEPFWAYAAYPHQTISPLTLLWKPTIRIDLPRLHGVTHLLPFDFSRASGALRVDEKKYQDLYILNEHLHQRSGWFVLVVLCTILG